MFGLKGKLKPRIKPVIAVNKASKSDDNRNGPGEPRSTVKDNPSEVSATLQHSVSPPSTVTDSELTVPESNEATPSVPHVEMTIPPLEDAQPEQSAPIASDSQPASQPEILSNQDSNSNSPTTDTPSVQPNPSTNPDPIPDSHATEPQLDSATVPEPTPLKPPSKLMEPPKLPPSKIRLNRKPAPLFRAKRKPIIPPVENIESSNQVESRLPPVEPLSNSKMNLTVSEEIASSKIVCDKPFENLKPVRLSQPDQEVKNKIGRPHVFKPTLDRQRTPKFTTSTYGKMSSEAKATMLKKFGTTTPDLADLTMLDLIFYNPKKNAMLNKSEKKSDFAIKSTELREAGNNSRDASNKDDSQGVSNKDENSNTQNSTLASPVPKIKLNSNGQAIVDTESIIIRNKAPDEVAGDTEITEESDGGKRGLKRKKRACNFWSHNDTILFYKTLLRFGSDFTMMLSEFPGRDRRCLKRKFKREEKINGKLIDKIIGSGFQRFDQDLLETELISRYGHSKTKTTQKSVDNNNSTKKKEKTVRRKRKRTRACDIINKGLVFSDEEENFLSGEDDSHENSNDSPDGSLIAVRDDSDNERSSVISEMASEDYIKEFLQNGKIVFNTSIVSNSLSYTQSMRFDSNRDDALDVNFTVTHADDSIVGPLV